MKTLITATALVLCTATAAVAANAPTSSTLLSSGPLYAPSEYTLMCEFINDGTTSITPTAQEIFGSNSTTAIGSAGTCANGTALAPNATCTIIPDGNVVTPGYSYSCKVTFSVAATKVRGALQLYDSSGNSLATTELR